MKTGSTHRLDDTTRCPACSARLGSWRCVACGLELRGPLATQLLEASVQAEHWIGERRRFIGALREQTREQAVERAREAARARPQTEAPPALRPHERSPEPPHPRTQHGDSPVRPQKRSPEQPQVRTRPVLRRGVGVQALLVGLGALLLAVAAVVFLAFSWDVLGLTGRAVVVATATVAVLAGAAWSRRVGLGVTAEAVAAVGVVLVLLDAGAVHATGLLGADDVPLLRYAAAAAAVVTVLLAAVGRLAHLRAGTVAAAVLAPLAPVLAGAAVADAGAGAPAVVLGLAGALVVSTVRGSRRLSDLEVERRTLAAAAVVATALAAPALVVVAVGDGAWTAALVATVLALVTAAQCAAGGRAGAWAATAGALLAAAVCLVSVALDPGTWLLAVAPLAVGAVALALASGVRAGPARRPVLVARFDAAAVGAAGVGLLALLPAAATVLGTVLGAPLLAVGAPWSTTPGTTLLQALVVPASGSGVDASDAALASTVVLASICALVGAAVLGAAADRVTGAGRLGQPATWLLVVAAVAVPLQPQAPVALSLATGLGVAAAAGAASVTVLARRRTAALCVAAVAGSSAVLLAWTVRDLSVPATLLGVAGLLLARHTTRTWRPLLSALATLATLVAAAAGARWAGADLADAIVVAGAAGAVAAVAGALWPVRGPAESERWERRAVLLPGLLAAAIGVVAAGEPLASDVVPVLAQLALLLGVGAVAASSVPARQDAPAGLAGHGHSRVGGGLGGGLSRSEQSVAAGAVPLVALATSLSATTTWSGPEPVLVAAFVVAATCAVAATLARLADHRRLALEVSACLLAAGTGAWVLALGTGTEAVLPLAVLAVAALVVAGAPDRRGVAWVALALGSLAWWLRLDAGDVGVVEVYTVPVAAVLLAVAARGTWRGRAGAGTSPAAITGAALAVVPTTLAGVVAGPWRLVAVVAVAVVALGAVAALGRVAALGAAPPPGRTSTPWRSWVPVLAGVAAVVALAGALPRALLVAADVGGRLGGLGDGLPGQPAWTVEVWALVAAALAMGALRADAGWSRRTRSHAPVAGLVILVVPSLVAVTGDAAGLARALAVIGVAGTALLARDLLARDLPSGDTEARTPSAAPGLVVVARWTAALAGLWGLAADVAGSAEAVTVPLGAVLVADGWLRMRTDRATQSAVLAPGLVVLLVPSLVLAVSSPDVWRLVGLAVVATAVVVLGAARSWAAPLLIGAAVLAVHALVQLAPVAVVAYEALPRWVTLAVAGSALIALGARYESRLADLRTMRDRLSDLR